MTSVDLSFLSPATVRACGRAAITGTLCALLAGQPVLAEYPPKKPAPVVRTTELRGEARVLHALNRLTFGPRPGDVAAVQKIGLDKWFEQQLNPAQIDDSALEARLSEWPAMNLPLAELVRRYPGPQVLKALSEGRGRLPSDPVQRQMVETQLKFYDMGRKIVQAAAKKDAAANVTSAPATGQTMSDAGGDMAMTVAPDPAMTPAKKKKAVDAGMAALENATPSSDMAAMAPDKPISAADLAPAPLVQAPTPEDRAALREQAAKLIAMPPADRFMAIMQLSPNQLNRLRNNQGPQAQTLVAGFTPEQKEILVALPGSQRMIALEEMESRLTRDIYSDRQLEAVMTDFWLNHFNVYVRKNQNEPYLIPAYERETIRPNALGNFETLLVATAKSPAMLEYLDNFRSIGPDSLQATRVARAKKIMPDAPILKLAGAGLNENYGRELMELHTLGVNGGYTQADVTMVSKVFTGWTIDKPYQGGDYLFNPRQHEPGAKMVLGKTISENGEQEGLEVLHMLATSPATAHFISQKLAVRFVSDDPPAALVDRMAASFLASNGDIKTVLRTMFKSPEFWATDANRAKVKTPEEFVVSALRASGAQVTNPQALVQSLDKLGQPLYGMQTPNGYSWKQDGWVSTGALVSRMNFALILTAGRLSGVQVDWTDLLAGKPAVVAASYSPKAVVDPTVTKEKRLEMVLLGAPVSDRTRATVIGQSNDQNVTDQAQTQFDLGGGAGKGQKYMPKPVRGAGQFMAAPDDPQAAVMAGLLLGSPEFQRR